MTPTFRFVYNDGGRLKAGYKGTAGDCVTRAIAIAEDMDYKEAYKLVKRVTNSSPRNGVKKKDTRKIMRELGYSWKPTMSIGSGTRVHVRPDELPRHRTLILNLSKHIATIKDDALQDIYDCSRNGTRAVYGYWFKRTSR